MYIERYILEATESFIKKHGTGHPEEIVKSIKNIDFAYEPLSNTLNGYYLYLSEKRQIIRVNSNLKTIEKQITLFHELSHHNLKHRGKILLNSAISINNIKEEYQADLFAIYAFIKHNNISKENINDYIVPERYRDLLHKFLD